MKLRNLRAARSVAWGIAAVLLIALWVRSYYISECFIVKNTAGQKVLAATAGIFEIGSCDPRFSDPRLPNDTQGWRYRSQISTIDDGMFYFHLVNKRNPRLFIIEFPIWLPTLIFSFLASVPFVLRWRFNVRTFLLATTLVAAVLELIVWLR